MNAFRGVTFLPDAFENSLFKMVITKCKSFLAATGTIDRETLKCFEK